MKDFINSKGGAIALLLANLASIWGCVLLLPRVEGDTKTVIVGAIATLGLALQGSVRGLFTSPKEEAK